MPPPWMSNSSPSQRRAIAEHSRCHPGRPGPNGVGHEALSGSSALRPFHSAKSRGSRLPRGSASSAFAMSSSDCPVSEPYSGHERTSKYTSPLPSGAAYACPFSTSVSMSETMSGTCPVARGS